MADLWYEIDNRGGAVRPGENVEVVLPLRGEAESLAVPHSALLHDIHGGAWIYERTQPRTYVRRRVRVERVVEGVAVLASGPKAGAQIVVEGAAELFGTEFYVSK